MYMYLRGVEILLYMHMYRAAVHSLDAECIFLEMATSNAFFSHELWTDGRKITVYTKSSSISLWLSRANKLIV